MREFSEFKIINHMDRVQAVLRGELPPPVTLEIDPTNACNHSCIWCIDSIHRQDNPSSLSREQALSVVEQASELGVRSLVIKGGGEPLVYPHIAELLRKARAEGFEVGVITNGERILDHAEVIRETCSWLRISLDSGSAEVHRTVHRPGNPDAFDKIHEGIAAVSDKVFCGIIYIVHPLTFHEMPLAARRVKETNCRYIAYKRVIAERELFDAEMLMNIESNYLFARRQYECEDFAVMGFRIYNFRDGLNKKPYDICLGHHMVGVLCANGEVYACCSTRGNAAYSYGNINEQSLKEIWHGDRRREVLGKIARKECNRLCVGHTSYMRYDHYNNLFAYLVEEQNPHENFL